MDEILWCDHSNETSSAVLSHDAIYLVCSSNFCVVDEIHRCDHSNEISSAVLSHAAIYLVWGRSLRGLWMKSYGLTIHIKPLR